MTPYTLRPGCDGRRIWQNFNDASRRDGSFFGVGVGGGWFRLVDSPVVFYFAHHWPDYEVKALTIADLEMKAASIAAALQLELQSALFGDDELHYFLQYGDNSSFSDHILQNMRASAPSLRFMAQERATINDVGFRLSASKQLHHEFNTAADFLANLDFRGFLHCMQSIAPGATCVRLQPSPDTVDLSKIIQWLTGVSALGSALSKTRV